MNVKITHQMTVAQQRAMDAEIDRQIAVNLEAVRVNLEALILWNLREQLGFGKKRLKRFHDAFAPALREMQDFYAMHDDRAQEWLCKRKLRDIGVDVEELCRNGNMLEIGYDEGKGRKDER